MQKVYGRGKAGGGGVICGERDVATRKNTAVVKNPGSSIDHLVKDGNDGISKVLISYLL